MPVNDGVDDTHVPSYLIIALVLIVLLIVLGSLCTSPRHITTTEQQLHQGGVEREHATYLVNARAAEEQRRQKAVRAQEAWKHKVAAEAYRARIEREAREKATLERVKIPTSYTIPSSSRAATQHNLKQSTAKRETITQVTDNRQLDATRDRIQSNLASGDAETKVANLRKLAAKSRESWKEAKKNLRAARKTGSTAAMQNWSGKVDQYHTDVIACTVLAATVAFKYHNPQYDKRTVKGLARCDLHGLIVKEAIQYVDDHLKACRELGVDSTVVITGKGNRSPDKIAKIKPAIVKLLQRRHIKHEVGVPNDGRITVWTKDQNQSASPSNLTDHYHDHHSDW